MRILDYIEKLHTLTNLLLIGNTGSLAKIADNMKVHRLTVYNYMSELRAMGAEIEYDRKRNTYYLKKPFVIELIIKN